MIRGGPFMAVLSIEEAEAFVRPVNGQGGFQSLLRALHKTYDRKSRTVTLTGDQIEKIKRYTSDYGVGGYEDRLAGIRRELPMLLK